MTVDPGPSAGGVPTEPVMVSSVPRFADAGAGVVTLAAALTVAALVLQVVSLALAAGAGGAGLLVAAVAQLLLAGVLVVVLWGLVRDRAQHAGRVAALVETDPLTGLPNRRRFLADVAAALRSAPQTVSVTVVLVALEQLTELRARLGQATAEDLQVAAARRLVEQAPDALTVGHLQSDVVGLAFGVMNAERAGTRAQHLVEAMRAPVDLPQLSLSVGAVIGMATGRAGSADAAGLLASAELALSAARGPAGPVVRFTPELERRDALAAQLVGELSDGIARGEVVAYFQPQMDLTTGQITGAEALVRWMHPALGLLGPAAFVPAAEVTGTIRTITLHILDQALYWCARWGREGRVINVSVNLSARDLLHARLVDDVREALARYALPATRLELEVTETMAMADVALSKKVLTDLARLGVTISIDDYGTGYGSLAYLQQLPVRRLKIDRSFVSRILDDEASMAIVRSTIELAGQLGLDTVAEGAEDDSTIARLREFGCGSVQGFGVAAPMSPESFERAIWRIEHRPRPAVASVRPAAPGSDVPAAAQRAVFPSSVQQAVFPSTAKAYHDLHDPGWWDGGPTPPGTTPPAAPVVPQPVPGSPLSAPDGLPHGAPHGAPPVPSAEPAPRGWVPQRQRAVVPATGQGPDQAVGAARPAEAGTEVRLSRRELRLQRERQTPADPPG